MRSEVAKSNSIAKAGGKRTREVESEDSEDEEALTVSSGKKVGRLNSPAAASSPHHSKASSGQKQTQTQGRAVAAVAPHASPHGQVPRANGPSLSPVRGIVQSRRALDEHTKGRDPLEACLQDAKHSSNSTSSSRSTPRVVSKRAEADRESTGRSRKAPASKAILSDEEDDGSVDTADQSNSGRQSASKNSRYVGVVLRQYDG